MNKTKISDTIDRILTIQSQIQDHLKLKVDVSFVIENSLSQSIF